MFSSAGGRQSGSKNKCGNISTTIKKFEELTEDDITAFTTTGKNNNIDAVLKFGSVSITLTEKIIKKLIKLLIELEELIKIKKEENKIILKKPLKL